MNYVILNITGFSLRDERFMYEGSSWTINSIIKYQLVISEISPCEGSSHFLLPKE